MNLNPIKENIIKNVYHIPSDKKVPLHSHEKYDEIFYCIKGSGYGILENEEIELTVGKAFIAPVGVKHSLRSDNNLYVTAFLIPIL